MQTDYTVISRPMFVNFICPHCLTENMLLFDEVMWNDVDGNFLIGGTANCKHCDKEVELEDGDYQ